MTTNQIIGSKIKQLRMLRRVKALELADYLGLSEACVSAIENGNRDLNIDLVQKIASFFHVSYNSLLPVESELSQA